MTEIEAMPWNGFKVVSTFSGCGGSCLGYRMAGYRVLWANEFIPAAQDVYRANHRSSVLDARDIRSISPADILTALGMEPGEIDIFDGSPPCASFSTAGSRESGWGKVKTYSDTKQRTDDLFFEYARLLKGLQPKVFVAENVSGLVKGVAKGYFLNILKTLKDCGYVVTAKLLDARWLGVPQMRQRVIFIGVRTDLGLPPVHPTPLPYQYVLRDAWTGVPDGPMLSFEDTKLYAKWKSRTPGKFDYSDTFNLKRLSMDRPSATVCMTVGHGTAAVTHPSLPRYPSIPELKRICGFPDDFILTGTFKQQWERIGRAVPPVMMFHVASTIRDQILCKLPNVTK
ncbi:MAG: DNA cytosine methyltransferase [Capsulimonadaceae bacterium]